MVGRSRVLKQDESTWPKHVVDKEPSDALREVKIKYMARSEDSCTMLSKSEIRLMKRW